MTENFDYCIIAGNTDVGLVRKANEDWFENFDCQNGRVAVVCDGMGGHIGGAIASHTAVEAIRGFLTNNYFNDPQKAIADAFDEANKAILNKALEDPALQGMGSTGLILIVREGKVYYGSIGDSRIYLIREHNIKRLTKDESYVQMLVDAGMDPEKAERHPRKNEITNALGLKGMTRAVTGVINDPRAGDSYLLCSDGLTGMVDESTINKIVSDKNITPLQRVDKLISLAKRNGGVDNITADILEFGLNPPGISNDNKSAIIKTTIIGLVALCVLAGIWFLFFNEKKGAVRDKAYLELSGLEFSPGSKDVKLFTLYNNDNTTTIKFNQSLFKGQEEYFIDEKIIIDSVNYNTTILYSKNYQDSTVYGFTVPDNGKDFPNELSIILNGGKSIYQISSKLSVLPADGGMMTQNDANSLKSTYSDDPKSLTNRKDNKIEPKVADNRKDVEVKKQTIEYQTSCKTIIIIAAKNNSGEQKNEEFKITSNQKLEPGEFYRDKDYKYSPAAKNGIFIRAEIEIYATDKPLEFEIPGELGNLKIKYNPVKEPATGSTLKTVTI